MKNNNKVARGVVKVVDKFLKIDANSTSCIITYQPKSPKMLEKYKKR